MTFKWSTLESSTKRIKSHVQNRQPVGICCRLREHTLCLWQPRGMGWGGVEGRLQRGGLHIVVVQSLSLVWPHKLQQARLPCPSLSPRISSNSGPLSQWCHPTISSSVVPFSSCPQSFPASGLFLFQWVGSSHQGAKVLELQHQIFQWTFTVDFLWDWLAWSCCPRDSRESSPAPQFKSINSSVLSLLYGLAFTSVHDYCENHSFDNMDLFWQNDVSAF